MIRRRVEEVGAAILDKIGMIVTTIDLEGPVLPTETISTSKAQLASQERVAIIVEDQ